MNQRMAFGNLFAVCAALAVTLIVADAQQASTYAVFIPLDDPIYYELDTLDGLGPARFVSAGNQADQPG